MLRIIKAIIFNDSVVPQGNFRSLFESSRKRELPSLFLQSQLCLKLQPNRGADAEKFLAQAF